MPHQNQSLDYANRWLSDSLRILKRSAVTYQVAVDMTNSLRRLETFRQKGVAASATHLLVQAAAKSFASNPALRQAVFGPKPDGDMDIGLSVSGETFIAPVLVLNGADQKNLAELAQEITNRVPQVQQLDMERNAKLRQWGWILPFGFLRRIVLRLLFANIKYKRRLAGAFQITTVPLDWSATTAFVACGVLVGGQVRSRVVAVNGQPAIRPIMIITLCGDHAVWDGRFASRFLSGVQTELESPPEI